LSNALNADLGEAKRQARIVSRAAGSYCGPAALGGIKAGEVSNGVVVPYGRVNITAVSDGFLPRRN